MENNLVGGTFTSEEAEAARHLMFHYGVEGGYPAGSFYHLLIQAMERADETNLFRLLHAFPAYHHPVMISRTEGARSLPNYLEGGQR